MVGAKQKVSLAEFAAAEDIKPGPPPWIDTIEERDEAVQAFRDGVRVSTIRRWLVSIHGDKVVGGSTLRSQLVDRS